MNRGHCQLCGEQITLISGEKVIKYLNINYKEGNIANIDLPFNMFALCPNCYAKALEENGRDFSKIIEYAKQFKQGDIFTEECERMNGDYIEVPIVVNGKKYELAISAEHMNYFK